MADDCVMNATMRIVNSGVKVDSINGGEVDTRYVAG